MEGFYRLFLKHINFLPKSAIKQEWQRQSMTRNPNKDDDDASIEKSGETTWSNLNHDVLFLVMMQLGVVDFISFSGVCKSWRSLALYNKKRFMASTPPMWLYIPKPPYKIECYLEDFEGRKFKPIVPHTAGRTCVGLTCGYLILFGRETKDFWLVNLITRHQLHFPSLPCLTDIVSLKAILVFSPSQSGWALVVLPIFSHKIWFSRSAGKRSWNHVSSTSFICDLHAFKGKIYTINTHYCLCELALNPKPKLTLLTNEDSWKPQYTPLKFASSGENLYMNNLSSKHPCIYELDFGKMKWMSSEEKIIREYDLFLSESQHGVVIKPESWLQYKRYGSLPYTDIHRKLRFSRSMWYFPHLCLEVDILDEL